MFSFIFLLVDGRIRTNNFGSGSRRAKNLWNLRIRIQSTGIYPPAWHAWFERWRKVTEVDFQIQLEFTVQWFGSHCQSNRCLSCPMTHSFKLFRTVTFFIAKDEFWVYLVNCGVLWEKTGRELRFFVVVLFRSNLSFPPTLYRKSDFCIPRNENARPHAQSYIHVSVSDLCVPRIGHRYMNVEIGRQNIIILFWK
jgi:hypothetical protein